MIITSWNCRGMGSKKKEDALKDILKSSKASILLLQETKMSQQDVLRTLSKVWKGSQGVAENARGASGGICTLWDASIFDMISSHTCMHWIHTKVHHKSTGCQVSLFNIYAPQILGEKIQCWDSLQTYLHQNNLPNIILGGDFNVTLAQDEKRGGSIVRDPAREWVEDIAAAWDLLDIKPTKGRYTWTNKRIGPGHIAARLDRFLVQSTFLVLGLETKTEILTHSASDHKPIRLEIKKDQVKGPIPFRFSPNWINDKGFSDIVAKVWATPIQGSASHVWEEKLKHLKFALKAWAKSQPSPAAVRLEAQALLEAHQLIMEQKEITPETLEKEDSLQREWHQACRLEENYWRQKSRSLWLKEGDRNTAYFHKQSEARKHYNAVTEVQVRDTIIADPEGIKQAALETFENLYTAPKEVELDQQAYPLNLIPNLINADTNSRLTSEITQQEIKEALDQMNPDKAPGPDGFTARFYQYCWEIIKKDLTKMIQKTQKVSKLGGSTNSSFLALIPKEKGARSFNRFRPISLCNTSYKIIAKVIANRLKTTLPLIVPENQGGFVQGRHIADNIILVQEAIHSSVLRKEKGMVIKLDLANAFDRVRHDFLYEIMKKFGFDLHFISWIKACIGSPWIAPLVNGKVSGFFKASRGLRQGCPLSPLLYALQASALSFQLENAQLHKDLMGLSITPGVKDINHAQFADDTLLLGGASPIIAKKFKEELDAYAEASGSEINLAKSNIYGWNITPNEMIRITRVMGMEGHTDWTAFQYLGVPIFKSAPRAYHWNHLTEKLKRKFSSWGANWLNLAGKTVLIKAVVASLPIYQCSLLLAPATVIQSLEAFQRRFLWEGGKHEKKKLHLVKWEKATKPYMEGGLNLKNTKTQNLALGAKLLWKMVTGKITWSKKAIWRKYFRGPRDRSLELPSKEVKSSPIFALCKKVIPLFTPHLTWVPKSGKKIRIWTDSIMGDPPLEQHQELQDLKSWMDSQNLSTLYDISDWELERPNLWQGWAAPNRPTNLERQWVILKKLLQGKAPLKKIGKDERGWGRKAQEYTTAEGYNLLQSIPTAPPNPALWKAIWKCRSIPKVDLFIWTLAHKSIPTGENLQRRGWEGPFRCPLCCQEEETSNHLLLNCNYSRAIWQKITGLQIFTRLPTDVESLLLQWESLCPFAGKKKTQTHWIWGLLPKLALWNLWLERNNRIFKESLLNEERLFTKIQAILGELAAHLSPTVELQKLDEEQRNWIVQFKVPELGRPHKLLPITEPWEIRGSGSDFITWKYNLKTPILQFDGASKGNPGPSGGGGTIQDPNQGTVMQYAIGLGIDTNNRAEALALWQGLKLAIKLNIQDLTVIGDSRIIIQTMVKGSNAHTIKLQSLMDKIRIITSKLNTCHFYHVLRDQNCVADQEANQGVLLEEGTLSVNGTLERVEIP
jgi:ribonuclease HI/exonuclease III